MNKYIKEKYRCYWSDVSPTIYTFKELLKEYKDKRKPKVKRVIKVEWIISKS